MKESEMRCVLEISELLGTAASEFFSAELRPMSLLKVPLIWTKEYSQNGILQRSALFALALFNILRPHCNCLDFLSLKGMDIAPKPQISSGTSLIFSREPPDEAASSCTAL